MSMADEIERVLAECVFDSLEMCPTCGNCFNCKKLEPIEKLLIYMSPILENIRQTEAASKRLDDAIDELRNQGQAMLTSSKTTKTYIQHVFVERDGELVCEWCGNALSMGSMYCSVSFEERLQRDAAEHNPTVYSMPHLWFTPTENDMLAARGACGLAAIGAAVMAYLYAQARSSINAARMALR